MESEKIQGNRGNTLKESLTPRPSPLAPLLVCPVCEKHFYESGDTVAMPFCSSRCKWIDAARWLDERYGMPCEKSEDDEHEP